MCEVLTPSRDNLDAADRLLSQLISPTPSDPDIYFEIQLLHIDLLIRRGNLSLALSKVESLITDLTDLDGVDIDQRVRLLALKVLVLDKCGRPEKGFSVAVRAASVAWRARLMPALWQAMGMIANILVHLREFEAAVKILASIMPQVGHLHVSTLR